MWHIFIFRTIFFNKMDGPLHECNNIIYLDFSNNYCHHISPQALQIQTQLRVLNFSRNYVGQSFQDDNSGEIMGRNSKLAFLNLHDTKITTLPRHVFIHNSMIKYLNISTDWTHGVLIFVTCLSFNFWICWQLNIWTQWVGHWFYFPSTKISLLLFKEILYLVREPFLFKLDK